MDGQTGIRQPPQAAHYVGTRVVFWWYLGSSRVVFGCYAGTRVVPGWYLGGSTVVLGWY